MPVYVEKEILSLPKIYINGGRRGYLIGIDPQILVQVLASVTVECGLEM